MGELCVEDQYWQNNDENNEQNNIVGNTPESMKNGKNEASEKLANASFVLGIISLFSVFCCCPFVISAIGITLALLSKGASVALKPKAKTGLILSVVGMATSLAVIISTLVMPFVMAKLNPEIGENFKQQYREVLEQNEDLYRDLYGDEVIEKMEDMIDNF